MCKKAQHMYSNGGINNNSMFYDKENGIMVDNRTIMPNTIMSIDYNQVQQKLLDAQNLLKQGLISQEDFNQIKNNLLKNVF